MVRKRIIRWISCLFLLVLLIFTVISNSVYQASLPRVRTRTVEQEVGKLLDGYGLWETFAWIPRDCVFPSGSEDTVCLYRVLQRGGQFTSTEDYVEAEEVLVLDEREDAVLVENYYLGFYDELVCESNLPLKNGETVIYLNSEE